MNNAAQKPADRAALAAAAGYKLVPVHPILRAREAANAQRAERSPKPVRHG